MKKLYICAGCGSKTYGKSYTKGSMGIELLLWICFIVPGLIYSVWRLTTTAKVCSKCKSADIVDPDTPRGKKLIAEYYPPWS